MALLGVVIASSLPGQSNRIVKFEDAKATAILITDAPHQKGMMTEHTLNRVFVYLDAGTTKRTMLDGTVQTVEYKAGDVKWVPASTYAAENMTDHPVRIVEVELKNKPPYSQSSSKLDPTIVVPEHYHVEFENEQTRVLRVTFAPHTKGGIHEHVLDRVVVQVKVAGTRSKPGDVSESHWAVHQDNNNTDDPQERIAIELK